MNGRAKRITKGEATRAQLIEAAIQLVQAEGVSSVTARRLADKVGLKRQIVHYYFGTIDDLLLEVMRTGFRHTCQAIALELTHRSPLDVVWGKLSHTTPEGAEFLALALRKKVFGDAMRDFSLELHQLVSDAISADYARRAVEPSEDPAAVALILQAVSQALGWEAALGLADGHDQARASLGALFRLT